MSETKVKTNKPWQKVKNLFEKGAFKKDIEATKSTQAKFEELNTAVYRSKYKIGKLHKAGNVLNRNGYMFLHNHKAFEIKVISDPSDSASDSVVTILKKGKQQFILKMTFVKKSEMKEFNFPDSEARMYKIMHTEYIYCIEVCIV